jgi:hypothetical protein
VSASLCAVLVTADPDGVVARAVADVGLESVSAGDADVLLLADFAVVDPAAADAAAGYALGVRDCERPHSTVRVAVPYEQAAIAAALRDARAVAAPVTEIARLKTDVFRDRARYSPALKARLAAAREEGEGAIRAIEAELGSVEQVETGVLVDLMLSYRAVGACDRMVELIERMPAPLQRSVMVREQLGFALNRVGRGREAEAVLRAVLAQHGSSSETYALLGRVYKDRWQASGEGLDEAIDAYRRGFEADWRDAYPGINAVTLMEIREPGGTPQQELLPVVRYADRRRFDAEPDYWDHATRLELAVLARDEGDARAAARAALAAVRERRWEPKSTAGNLALIREARAQHGERLEWAGELERELLGRAG